MRVQIVNENLYAYPATHPKNTRSSKPTAMQFNNSTNCFYYPVNFKKLATTQELWVQKSSVQDILNANSIKYNNLASSNKNIHAKDLLNKNTIVLGETVIYDKDERKDIDCCFALTKKEREYRVVIVKKETAIEDIKKENYVASMRFKVIPKEGLKLFFKGELNKDKIEEVIDTQKNRDFVTIIGGFSNSESHRYINAGKKVGLCALQLFEKFGIENVFYCAFPTTGSNSPMPYYLRGGFKLIDCSEEDILKATNNYKERLNQTRRISMMMPNDAPVLKLAQQYNFLKDF